MGRTNVDRPSVFHGSDPAGEMEEITRIAKAAYSKDRPQGGEAFGGRPRV